MNPAHSDRGLHRAVQLVAVLNLSYFVVEFTVARLTGSVSLFADSVDFLEDASLSILILIGLRWSAVARSRLGMALAGILLLPGIATIWTAWEKINLPIPPAAVPLSLAGGGALVVNLACALLLAKHKSAQGSLTRAAFLSARNDVLANIAIIISGVITAFFRSAWPDLVVGLGIAVMNADAAHEVWTAARREHKAANS